jgi:hypothetical protein
MHRFPTPSPYALPRIVRRMPATLKVSGTVTVCCVLGMARPSASAAQAIGTMQVRAEVSRADAAWSGLAAAQQLARDLAGRSKPSLTRRLDLPLTSAELRVPPAIPAAVQPQPVVTIQYLHN